MDRVEVKIEPLRISVWVTKGILLKDVLTDYGVDFPCSGRGTCGKCKFKLLSGHIELSQPHADFTHKKGWAPEWHLACYSRVTEDITVHIEQLDDNSILSETSTFEFNPQDGFGMAIDLGSTTIVSQLVDLNNSEVIVTRANMNPQSSYGADIISRIAFAMESPENLQLLSNLVRDVAYDHIKEFSEIATTPPKVILVGNSVMHHLFCAIDPTPLASYPFESKHNNQVILSSSDLGWDLPYEVQLQFMPNISHFVGSDILAGILAVGMDRSPKCQMLIDLGTNGEIVIGNKDRLICTSTAAGPAFEGVNISQGMKATLGAIYKIETSDQGVANCSVIGGIEAKGLCGSGLIDAVQHLINCDKIDITGMVTTGAQSLRICDHVSLSDADIREFQLAKSAIATGIHFLLQNFGVNISEVENVYISGGLGTYVNAEHAISIGLLQLSDTSQLNKAKNSALAGAKQLLFPEYQALVSPILGRIEYCSLETQPEFQDVYCDNLYFMQA